MKTNITPISSKGDIYNNRMVQEQNNGYYKFLGIETGKISLEKLEGHNAMFKISGHNYNSGKFGITSYAQPKYLIGVYKDSKFNCKHMIEYGKESMREAKLMANNLFNRLISENKEHLLKQLSNDLF